jgi:hypothetical protein
MIKMAEHKHDKKCLANLELSPAILSTAELQGSIDLSGGRDRPVALGTSKRAISKGCKNEEFWELCVKGAALRAGGKDFC